MLLDTSYVEHFLIGTTVNHAASKYQIESEIEIYVDYNQSDILDWVFLHVLVQILIVTASSNL